MHETVIADKIIKEAKKNGKVEKVYIEIGELAAVQASELVECLKRLVEWQITYKEKPASVKCACGFKGHPKILYRGHDSFLIECPKCKKMPNLVSGDKIKLLKVIVK